MNNQVSIHNETDYIVNDALIDEITALIISHQELSHEIELSLAFVDEKTIQTLNAQYRGKDYPTDVLSFAEQDVEGDEISGEKNGFIGEVIICTEVMKRQASEKKHSVDKECAILFIHGFLHILGYDHIIDEEAEIMEGIEKEILNKISIQL